MPSGKHLGEPLIIARKATKPSQPSVRSFNNPTAREQDKALLRSRVLYDLQLDAVIARLLRRIFTGIALIRVSDFDRATRYLLHFGSQLGDLLSLLFVASGYF